MDPIATKQHSLFRYIEQQVEKGSRPWVAPIYCSACHVEIPHFAPTNFAQLDLVRFLKQPMQPLTLGFVYLNPALYPFSDDKLQQSIATLCSDLTESARQNGFELVRNGTTASKTKSTKSGFPLQFRCSCLRAMQAPKGQPTDFRTCSYHNDKNKNRRTHGRKKKRKGETKLAASSCHFSFLVHLGEYGFFIKAGFGNGLHSNHTKMSLSAMSTQIKTIKQDSRSLLDKLAQSGVSAAQARNFLYNDPQLNRLSYKQIYRYFGDNNKGKVGDFDPTNLPPGANLPPSGSHLLDYLRSRSDISCCIYASGSPDATDGRCYWVFNETQSPGKPNTIRPLEDICGDVVEEYKQKRIDERLKNNESDLISAAWCTANQKKMVLLDPSVLKVDATCKTNNEKRELLTFSARVPNGRYFICLQVFLPDSCASTFAWVFQVVLPELFGEQVVKKIRHMITDGDSQEVDVLRRTIARHMPWVHQGRCAWHIIYKGFDRRCPHASSVGSDPIARKAFKAMVKFILTWAYSWMYSGHCESLEELVVSACIFQSFLDSDDVLKAFGLQHYLVDMVKKFFCSHVFNLFEDFAFYPRIYLRHYDECTNSSHEGTNFGIKGHATPVLPSMSTARSAQVQNLQSDLKMSEFEKVAAAAAHRRPTWIRSTTSDHLNTIAEGLLLNETELSTKYVVRKQGDEWAVVFNYIDFPNQSSTAMDGGNPKKLLKLIPRFRHIRRVRQQTSYFTCSCGNFERFGIPCRHQIAVAKANCDDFEGFTHHDVSVVWWRIYSHLAYTRDGHNDSLASALEQLSNEDIRGPVIRTKPECRGSSSCDMLKYDSLFAEGGAIERCRNYKPDIVLDAVKSYSTHIGSAASVSFTFTNHEQMATYHGNDCLQEMDDCDDNNGIVEELPPGNRVRNELMPWVQKLLDLHESPNIISSAAPYQHLIEAIKRDIETLHNSAVQESQYSLSQLSQSSFVSTRRVREPSRKRTQVAHHGFQSKRWKDK